VLFVRKAGGTQQEYMTIKLTDILITGFKQEPPEGWSTSSVAVADVSEVDVHTHIASVRLPELETLIVSGIITRDDWPAVRLKRAGAYGRLTRT
jgi:hypothetical protein